MLAVLWPLHFSVMGFYALLAQGLTCLIFGLLRCCEVILTSLWCPLLPYMGLTLSSRLEALAALAQHRLDRRLDLFMSCLPDFFVFFWFFIVELYGLVCS